MESITGLFPIPENYTLTEQTIRYFGSLVPPTKLIAQMREIRYTITLELPQVTSIEPENPINNHLFKPRFFIIDREKGIVGAHVPCREVLAHSLRGLAVFSHHIGNPSIKVSIDDKEQRILDFCQAWKIADKVIICQVESFLKFLKVFWMLKNGVPREFVNRVISRLENRFLNNAEDKSLQAALERIDIEGQKGFRNMFPVTIQPIITPLVVSAMVRIGDVTLSLVQLPWGAKLAEELIKTILVINNNIVFLGSVGGVAYWRKDNLFLDDIFIPMGTVVDKDGGQMPSPLQNPILDSPENIYFTEKNVGNGYLKTVSPELGVLSNTERLRPYLGRTIHAVDNEVEGMRNALDSFSTVAYGTIHYIMDAPMRGVHLGDTYYNRAYLERLFNDPNRGKYYCFERMLSSII